MAQLTGTNILALARLFAQDTSASNPAVSDSNALLLMNDVLLRYGGDVMAKHAFVPAFVSGLTFAANVGIASTTPSDYFDHILAAYESDTSSALTILPPPLTLWTVEQMHGAYNNNYDGTIVGGGTSGWQAYAWERAASNSDTETDVQFRVYVYPVLAATRYMTLRVPRNHIIGALTETPELTHRESRIVARLLAWEMARLHQRDDAFLQQILSPIPNGVLDKYFESAKTHGWMQAAIRETGALDG